MDELIGELERAGKTTLEAVEALYKKRGNTLIAEDWTLKDVLAHFCGWALYQIDVLKCFQVGQTPKRIVDVQAFNKGAVRSGSHLEYEEVCDKFKKTGAGLVREYKNLATDLWEKPIWPDKETTPADFIRIEITHYQKTHLPQIRRLLSESTN